MTAQQALQVKILWVAMQTERRTALMSAFWALTALAVSVWSLWFMVMFAVFYLVMEFALANYDHYRRELLQIETRRWHDLAQDLADLDRDPHDAHHHQDDPGKP